MISDRQARILSTLAIAVLSAIIMTVPAASAMPPAHGLTDAEATDAADVLEAATERGVGDLPASPFLQATPCGIADASVRVNARRHRVALVSLRAAQRSRSDVAAAQRAVRQQRARLKAATTRRATICSPSQQRSSTDEEDGTLRGTTTAERPRSVVAGTGMVITLPIEFADVRANRSVHTPSKYRDLLFGEDYPFGGGSLASFYEAMSYGSFTVDGDVEPWRRMPKRRAAYAADNGGMGAYPGNSQSLLEDAVKVNDASVDFAKYDNDGPDRKPNSGDDDGFVDTVFLVYAGSSAAENGNLDALWPHAWRHTVATGDRSANGGFVKVGRYAAVPERMEETGPDGDLLTVGVVAHEFGHVLGLPDLVDGEGGHRGPGAWDLMSSGMWGFKHSSRPSGLSAWSRARLGWVTPQLLEGDNVGYRLGSSYAQRSIVKLPIAGEPLNEHYLVERRTRIGFDSDAPGDGLLVWHVDDSIAAGGTSAHPRVELVAADGNASGDAGDLLGAAGHLSDSTTPSTKAHDGSDSLVAIQNVLDATVDLHAGKASLAPAIDAAIDDAGPQAAFPTAVLTAPIAGARLRGTVPMSCNGTGAPNLNRISFQRSGTNLTNVAVTPTAATATRTYNWNTGALNGNYTMTCAARNTSNQTTTSAGIAVVLDNTAPATPTMSAPAASPAWLRGTVGWTATGTDNYGVTTFSYRVDGVDNWQTAWAELTPKTNTYNWDTTTATNGNHTLTVRSQDLAGGLSAVSANRTVRVDNALPTMTVPDDGTSLPDIDQQTSMTTLNARWTAGTDANSGISSYSWRFCTTPACGTVVASGSGAGLTATAGSLSLAVGTYYACVRVTDVAGNQSADSCSDGVIADNVAPTMSTPNDGAAADIDSQLSTSALTANWTAANDGAGTGVASYAWRFCTTTACGTILASGSGAGTTASATGLTLATGTTYFACVRAVDQLGNTSAYACSDGVVIDTAPTVNITSPATGSAATGTVAVDATATDVGGIVSFEFRLDGVLQQTFGPLAALSPRSITWNWNSTAASEGSHSIEVTAYDGTGLTDTDTITLTVDRTAPGAVTHGGIGAGSIVSGVVNFTAGASDAGGVDRLDYWIDGVSRASAPAGGAASFSDPGTPFNTASLLDGNHGYIAVAYDRAGNMALTGTPETFFVVNNNIEGVQPTGTVTSPGAGALAASNVSLTANVSDNNVVVKIEWLLDGTAIPGVAADVVPPGYTGGSRTRTWSSTGGVAAGPHTISARVTDASGNQFTTAVVNVTK